MSNYSLYTYRTVLYFKPNIDDLKLMVVEYYQLIVHVKVKVVAENKN